MAAAGGLMGSATTAVAPPAAGHSELIARAVVTSQSPTAPPNQRHEAVALLEQVRFPASIFMSMCGVVVKASDLAELCDLVFGIAAGHLHHSSSSWVPTHAYTAQCTAGS